MLGVRKVAGIVVVMVLGWSVAMAQDKFDTEAVLEKLDKGALRVGNDDFEALLHGRIQTWFGYVQDDANLQNGDPMQRSGFRLRRARLGLEGGYKQFVRFSLELDAFDKEKTGGPLYEAYLTIKPMKFFGGTIGFQKYPFSYSAMRSSARLATMDRAMGVYAMSPWSTVGLVLFAEPWVEHIRISAGVFNGLQRAQSFHEGYKEQGSSLGQRFERASFVGRLDIMPFGDIGKDTADLAHSKSPKLAFGGACFYNDGDTFDVLAASGYAHLKFYGAHFVGEVLWDWSKLQSRPSDPQAIAGPTEYKRLTAYAEAGYTYWNLGLAVRGEYLNDNTDKRTQGDEYAITGTLTYYAIGNYLKAQIEYTHRGEIGGQKLKNDNLLGGVQIAF